MFGNAHLVTGRGRAATSVVVEESRWFRDFDVVKGLEMAQGGFPSAVRGLVLAHEEKRLLGVSLLQPSQCLVGDDVGRVAGVLDGFAVCQQARVVVLALSSQDFIVIESSRCGFEMPLPDNCRLVASPTQQFGDGLLGTIENLPVRHLTIEVGIFPGEDDRSRWGAD